jgi:hypothetical protein
MLNGCNNYPFECACESCHKAHNDPETRIKLGVYNISVVFRTELHPTLENSMSLMAPNGIYFVIIEDVIGVKSAGSLRLNVRHALQHRLNISRSLVYDCYGDTDSAKRELSDVALRIPHYGGELNIYASGACHIDLKVQVVKQAALDVEPEVWRFSRNEILSNIISHQHIESEDGQQFAWLLCSLWNHVMRKGQNLYLKVPRIDSVLVLDDINSFMDTYDDTMIGHLHVKRLVKVL